MSWALALRNNIMDKKIVTIDEKIVTIKDICKRSGIHPSTIQSCRMRGDFPQPVNAHTTPCRPYYFKVSEVNKWIIAYGSKLINMQEVACLLQVPFRAIDYLIRKHGFPEKHTITDKGPMWLRISVINWRKKHPYWYDLIRNFMRQNK